MSRPPTAVPAGGAYRVLIADDEDSLRDLLATVLEAQGIQVTQARDGNEAVELAHQADPHLLLLDFQMPGRNGLEVLAEVRRDRDALELPVVFLTAETGEAVRLGGFEAGANDYLQKPFEMPELIARVWRLLRLARAERDLREERALQQRRLELVLEGSAMLATMASEDAIYSTVDAKLRSRLSLRIGVVLMLDDSSGEAKRVYPSQGEEEGRAPEDLSILLSLWKEEGPPVEVLTEGYESQLPGRKGELWFPIQGRGSLLGTVGFKSTGDEVVEGALHPGNRQVLASLSRLLGMATEHRELLAREERRVAQEAEMHSAVVAQERVLPEATPSLPSLDVGAVTLAARDTGGDYYSFFEYSDGSVGALIADVVGKGATAAMHTMVLNTLVREHAPLSDGPEDLLRRMNGVLHGPLGWEREDPIPCTALRLGREGPPAAVEVANAGHEPLLFVKAGGDAAWMAEGRCFPLGWMEEARLTTLTLGLSPGDILVMYTDGVVDAAGWGRRPRSDVEGRPSDLAQWLRLPGAPLVHLTLRKLVDRVRREPSLADDFTLLIVRGGTVLHETEVYEHRWENGLDLYVSSAPEGVRRCRDLVGEFLIEEGVEAGDIDLVQAVLTEVHTNAVLYGHKGRRDQPIRIGLERAEEGGIWTEVEEFHCGGYRAPDIPDMPELHPDGSGMGLVLAQKVMDVVEYVTSERISFRVRMLWRGTYT